MNYPLVIAGIRKLNRPLPCIIEHIKAEPAADVENQGVGRGKRLRV